ncbi:hypothetical protein D3C71_1988900 [compost metagenome]
MKRISFPVVDDNSLIADRNRRAAVELDIQLIDVFPVKMLEKEGEFLRHLADGILKFLDTVHSAHIRNIEARHD